MPSGLPHKPVRSFQQTDTHEVFSVHAFRNTCAQNMVQDSFSHHVDHIRGQAHKHTHTHMAKMNQPFEKASTCKVHTNTRPSSSSMPVCFCMLKNMQTHAQAVACCLSIVPCSKTHKHMRNTRWSSILMPVCAFDAQKHKHARHTPKQYLDVCVFFHAQKYTSPRKHTLEQYLDACVFLHTQKHANTRQSTSECPHTIQYAKSDAAGTSSLNFSRIFITSGSKGPKLCIQRHNSTCVRVSCQLWTLNRDAQ
jgi:hypothetical protein